MKYWRAVHVLVVKGLTERALASLIQKQCVSSLLSGSLQTQTSQIIIIYV